MRLNAITTAAALAAIASVALAVVAGAKVMAPVRAEPSAPATRVVGGGQPFADDFASLDKSRWNVSDGWYNGKYMVNDWRGSQTRIGNGGMVLTLAPNRTDKADFSSGEIQSRRNFGHGYYEVAMQAAPGSGTVTGFFTYTGPPFGKPWDEIDVEVIGRKPREVMFTYFRKGEKVSKIVPLDFDTTAGMHHYGFDWQPDLITWYVDGKLAHIARGDDLPLPRETQKIMASLWASSTLTDWVGRFDTAALPTSARIGCISFSDSFATRQGCD